MSAATELLQPTRAHSPVASPELSALFGSSLCHKGTVWVDRSQSSRCALKMRSLPNGQRRGAEDIAVRGLSPCTLVHCSEVEEQSHRDGWARPRAAHRPFSFGKARAHSRRPHAHFGCRRAASWLTPAMVSWKPIELAVGFTVTTRPLTFIRTEPLPSVTRSLGAVSVGIF